MIQIEETDLGYVEHLCRRAKIAFDPRLHAYGYMPIKT